METIIKKFNSREEVIAMRSKMSSTYATIVNSADKSGLEKGHYVEVSHKHLTTPFGLTFPCELRISLK